ncbi:DNA-binding XRE family transcriptional regulator [Arthrobacter sp. SLBN-112]|nr:DNA-binding XRE family transcriptional regulator [Arthrobacter sp. SLBN-112]
MSPSSWNRDVSQPPSTAVAELDVIALGRRVRHLRKQAGLTLDDLSAAVGTAPSQLSLIENGKREPKLTLLQHPRGGAQCQHRPTAGGRAAQPPCRP